MDAEELLLLGSCPRLRGVVAQVDFLHERRTLQGLFYLSRAQLREQVKAETKSAWLSGKDICFLDACGLAFNTFSKAFRVFREDWQAMFILASQFKMFDRLVMSEQHSNTTTNA